MTTSELYHHYSQETGVSLELPSDWDEIDEDEGFAIYAATSEHTRDPQIMIQWQPAYADDDYQLLAQAVLNRSWLEKQVLANYETSVDGKPAFIVVMSFYHDDFEIHTAQYQAFIQYKDRVYSFVGMVEAPYAEQYLPIFEGAFQSLRFVEE
jgi:hypothetical protein